MKPTHLLTSVLEFYDQSATAMTEAAVQAFMGNLATSQCPSSGELSSAMTAARTTLEERLFHRDTIRMLADGEISDDRHLAAVRLSYRQFTLLLECPAFSMYSEVPPARLAIAALLGAVAGGLFGSPIGIYLLDNRDMGLLVGAPLGAFATTWLVSHAARSKWLSNSLIAALGLATAAEMWAYFSTDPVSAIWRRLTGRNSIVRVVVYMLLIGFLMATRGRTTYDRSALEQSVRQSIKHWLPGAIFLLAVMIQGRPRADADAVGDGTAELGQRILELHAASAANLAGHAQDVIDAAQNAGFDGLEGVPNFYRTEKPDEVQDLQWAESMRDRYNVFGNIDTGDRVLIEEEAVVFQGEVIKKGLVRKQRRR